MSDILQAVCTNSMHFICNITSLHTGMLYYSPQIWCSDNTDALIRMKIQYGTSLAYPTRCVGAHISTVPNHITGSTVRSFCYFRSTCTLILFLPRAFFISCDGLVEIFVSCVGPSSPLTATLLFNFFLTIRLACARVPLWRCAVPLASSWTSPPPPLKTCWVSGERVHCCKCDYVVWCLVLFAYARPYRCVYR